jgi:hypothetical protein
MSTIRRKSVDLFTPDEHAVLSHWFGVKPPKCARDIWAGDAAENLGFKEETRRYGRIAAAAAFIVLERAEARLPQWAGVSETGDVLLARKYRDRGSIPDRTVVLQPRHLLTIDWAASGPGFSWPVAYYLTWLPHYDRYVVTASADSPDAFGYCDFAIGSFRIKKPIKVGAEEIIGTDWWNQRLEWEQQRWDCLMKPGLISAAEAEAWADDVWAPEPAEEDEQEEDAA